MRGERTIVGGLLVVLGVALGVRADQPIVENYVGRQVPTAMVARNLARGSGFLRPTLDTAPFPNRFTVEPPIYAGVVAIVATRVDSVREALGWPPDGSVWERSGRLTSALLTVLGAWAFWGLTRRREGAITAALTLGAFACLPVVLRYGRAFQPDAFVVGLVLLGLRAWDEFAATARTRWAIVGGLVLALGLATKITVAWCLLPWFALMARVAPPFRLMIASAMMAPALAWYLHAWGDVTPGGAGGSRASADNAAIWLRTLSPLGWLRWATWREVGGNLVARAFTPVGFVLTVAGWGLAGRRGTIDPFWRSWAIGVGLAILALGAKWHHGYYWLVAAPLAAVGIARALLGSFRLGVRLAAWWRVNSGWCDPVDPTQAERPARLAGGLGSFLLGASFVICAAVQTGSTWRTPPEWRGIRESAARIAALVGPDDRRLLVAPEAVLYYVDRPGYRLEFAPEAMARAAGEWGGDLALDQARRDPLALVDFYRTRTTGDPAERLGPDDPGATSRFRKIDHRAGLVADVGLITRRGEPREVFRAAVRRLADIEAALADPAAPSGARATFRSTRPGIRILIDEPALFVMDPGGPPR